MKTHLPAGFAASLSTRRYPGTGTSRATGRHLNPWPVGRHLLCRAFTRHSNSASHPTPEHLNDLGLRIGLSESDWDVLLRLKKLGHTGLASVWAADRAVGGHIADGSRDLRSTSSCCTSYSPAGCQFPDSPGWLLSIVRCAFRAGARHCGMPADRQGHSWTMCR